MWAMAGGITTSCIKAAKLQQGQGNTLHNEMRWLHKRLSSKLEKYKKCVYMNLLYLVLNKLVLIAFQKSWLKQIKIS